MSDRSWRLIRLSLGVLGGGGSTLAVPIFVYVLGFGAKAAIASSLAVVGATSLFGAAEHWRDGHARLRAAFVLYQSRGVIPLL